MADHKVRIIIEADSSKARAELEKLQREFGALHAGDGVPLPAPPPSAPPTPSAPSAPSAPSDPVRQGREIGRALVGFIAARGIDAAFTASAGPFGPSPRQSTVRSSVSGLVAGAAAGSMFGPWGALLGAAAGGGGGLVSGLFAERDGRIKALWQQRQAEWGVSLAGAQRRSDAAFSRSLSLMGGAGAEAAIEARIESIERGAGDNSIRNLEERLQALRGRNKAGTPIYEAVLGQYQSQLSRVEALKDARQRLRWDSAPGLLNAADYSDAWSSRGIHATGRPADVAGANDRIIAVLETIARNTEREASRPDVGGGWDAMERVAAFAR